MERSTNIIWGAATKLVAENKDIQEKIKVALYVGVKVSACKSCAEELGVTESIEALGIDLKYWDEDLTKVLQQEETLLTIQTKSRLKVGLINL